MTGPPGGPGSGDRAEPLAVGAGAGYNLPGEKTMKTHTKAHAASVAAVLAAGFLAACSGLLAVPSSEGPASRPAKVTAEALEQWGGAPIVFVGKLQQVQAGPMGLSEPPMRTHKLTFAVAEVLRGDVEAGKALVCNHVVRGAEPTFPQGKNCVVAAAASRGGVQALTVREATADVLAQARTACSVPLGWSVRNGLLLSPWANMGEKAWPASARSSGPLACAKTGRPALLAGRDVKFSVAHVPPKQAIKWTNPDGDGEYEITVENPTDKAIDVPALLTDGKEVLWNESLVILCQDRAYTAPLSQGVAGAVKAVRLAPGQKLSGRVNVLMLVGPQWPQGGYRIEFTFCLGEKANLQSLYYMSRHHDKLRDEALRELRAKRPPAGEEAGK